MNVRSRLRWFLLRGLGIPEGQSPAYYKTVASGLGFIPAAIVFLLHAHLGTFGGIFWSALAIAITTLFLAPRRALLVAGLLAVLAVRFAVGFVVTLDYLLFLAACGSGATAVVIILKFDH